jgi:hypothetical protein
VRAAVAAWIAALLLGLISVVYQFANLTEVVDDTLEATGGAAAVDPGFFRTVVVVQLVFTLVVQALVGMFVGFAWAGRNWARIVLWVLGGLQIVSGAVGVASRSYLPGFLQGLTLCSYVLVVAGVVLLAQPAAHAWYRNRRERAAYERWSRNAGLRR